MELLHNKVSIFIPTYNRWGALKKTLPHLLKYAPKDLTIQIVNNASTKNECRNDVEAIVKKSDKKNLSIIDYKVNVGGEGNFLRCAELCQTEYIWVLGDDDFIHEDAFINLEHVLLSPVNYGWINFYVENKYDNRSYGNRIFNSPFVMINASPNWAELMFISSNIYSTDLLKKGLFFGHKWQATLSVLPLAVSKGWECLDENDHQLNFLLSEEMLIKLTGVGEMHYDQIDVYSSLPLLEKVHFSSGQASSSIKNALRRATRHIFKPRVVIKHLIERVCDDGFIKGFRIFYKVSKGLPYMIGPLKSLFYIIYGNFMLIVVAFLSMLGLKSRKVRRA